MAIRAFVVRSRAVRLAPLLVLGALAASSAVRAQVEIDRRRPAPARGRVEIDNAFGSVVVRGWERNEVLVQGTVAAGAESFDFDGDKEGLSISVSIPEAWFQAAGEEPSFRTTLTVFVPAASTLEVSSVNAAVSVEGVTGGIELETVNGGVKIVGARSALAVETMTGNIEIQAIAAPMDLRSISGAVVVEGAAGEVQVETVSGRVSVAGESLTSLGVETTTGPVEFRGSLAPRGKLEVETFSGPVKLRLPRTTKALFDLRSFAGKIQSQFCSGTPVTRERFEPFRELRCSTGPDELELSVRTHDADIVIEAQ